MGEKLRLGGRTGALKPESQVPGPPKEPKILAQYPKIESIGSIGSIILAIVGGPGSPKRIGNCILK